MADLIKKISVNFDLNGVTEVSFWKSEWEAFDPSDRLTRVSYGYLIYRFVFMAFFIITLTADFLCNTELSMQFIYTTYISYTVQTVHSVLLFLVVVVARLNQGKAVKTRCDPGTSLPWIYKLTWITTSILNAVPFTVTSTFWILVYERDYNRTACENVVNYFLHVGNSAAALTDNLIIAVPSPITHIIFPMGFEFCYMLFTGLYELGGGKYEKEKQYIYAFLNWKTQPGQALGCAVGLVIVTGFMYIVFGWGVYRLRVYLVHKFTNKNLNFEDNSCQQLTGNAN